MTNTPAEEDKGIQPALEEIVSGLENLSISPAPRPPLVVSKQRANTELNLRNKRRKPNMAFIVGRG